MRGHIRAFKTAIPSWRESKFPGGCAHACELETSLYLYLDGDNVRNDLIKSGDLKYSWVTVGPVACLAILVTGAAWQKIMKDWRMKPDHTNMPFDGKRMIYGGFTPIVDA